MLPSIRVMYFVVFDCEAPPDKREVGEIAWLVYSQRGTVLTATHAFLVPPNPPRRQKTVLGTVRGESVAFIEEHTTLQQVLDDLKTIAGRYSPASFISHHVEWDAAVIHAAEQECGTQTGLPGLPRVCTMLATADKYGGGHFLKLGELYHALFGEDFEHPHDARADVTACAECFWELKARGELDDYDHARLRERFRYRSLGEIEWEVSTILRRHLRSSIAKAAWDRRKERARAWRDGFDTVVLQRIRELSAAGFGAFLAHYTRLSCPSSAAYIKRVLSQEQDVLLKPETSWRCIVAYCGVAEPWERGELARMYLSQASRSSRYVEVALGREDPSVDSIVREAFVIPSRTKEQLLAICAGHAALAAEVEAEHISTHGEKGAQVTQVMRRCASGDRGICGAHRFTLPFIELTLTVENPSSIRRLFSFVGQMLGGR